MKKYLALPAVLVLVCCISPGVFAQSGVASARARPAAAYLIRLQQKADRLGLDSRRQWHTLMHYRSTLFGGRESDVDSRAFFLAENGKTNPRAELQATLAAFFEPARPSAPGGKYDPAREHPQCRFRARYTWLKQALDFDPARLPTHDCEDFKVWKQTLRAESATLIFASSYINNPASMFGHTMLRLDRGRDAGSLLTSYVVSFAATPWTNNPVLYSVLGLTGGFDANFSVLPFYLKVREYTAMENRDLWEFRLNLADVELQRLIEHLWELQAYSIDYYYLDENCSFYLLSLLEAARPSLRLTEKFSSFVTPVDTLREVLRVNGLSDGHDFRPAQRRKMLANRARLNANEGDMAGRLGRGPDAAALVALADYAQPRQAAVLDAAVALWAYNYGGDETVDKTWKYKLLTARSRLNQPSPQLEINAESAPQAGHKTSRVTLAGGVSRHEDGFAEVGIRPALHDLAAFEEGYAPLAQIEFLNLRARAIGLNKRLEAPEFILQRFDLLKIMSLVPLATWTKKWSWGLETGFGRTYRAGCPAYGCMIYDFAVGMGGTLQWGPMAVYSLLDAEVALGATFEHNVRLAAGPRAGALLRLGSLMRVYLEGRYRYPFLGVSGWAAPIPRAGRRQPPWSTRATASFRLGPDTEARLNAVWGRRRAELGAAFHLYW